MKIKSKEFRFRTSKSEIINLIENSNRSFSKNIEDILLEFINLNMKIEYIEQQNKVLKEYNDALNSIISFNHEEPIREKRVKTDKQQNKRNIVLTDEAKNNEPITFEKEVKDSLKNMFDD